MNTLEIIRPLGFTEYEGKAYLALLRESPLTGYAAAKNSGVPRAKIYEVLNSLTARGDVLVSPGDPPLYSALPVRELIEKHRRQTEAALTRAEAELQRYELPSCDHENIWNLTGPEAIWSKIREAIVSASGRILMEIWAEDFPGIQAELEAAAKRGVRILLVTYGEISAPWAEIYRHDRDEEITREYGGRWIVFSADDAQVIAGTVSPESPCRAAWSRHPGLVMPITEVIIHDLYVWEMLNAHREALEETFGKHLSKLRAKFPAYGAGTGEDMHP